MSDEPGLEHGCIAISLTINGQIHEVSVAPHATLLDLVRDQLGLTGTKKG